MADVAFSWVDTPLSGSGLKIGVWGPLAAGDTALPVACGAFPDKSVQFTGAFGGAMGLEGSVSPDPDTATFSTLNDPQGTPISGIAAAKIENILEHCYLVRPTIGGGVANTYVWLLLSNVKG